MNKQIQDILETVTFLKDNMVTKTELDERLRGFATKDDLKSFATKDDLHELEGNFFMLKQDLISFKDEIITRIDGLVTLHNKHHLEIVSLRSAHERLEGRVSNLESRFV